MLNMIQLEQEMIKQCIMLKAQTRAETYVDQTRCLKKFDFEDMVVQFLFFFFIRRLSKFTKMKFKGIDGGSHKWCQSNSL
jgi:hypothetical protein